MKIKVCGMGSNMEAVARLQPDYLGFIFWEPSSRYFEGKIKAGLNVPRIGVFVDAEIQDILEHVRKYDLNGVQLHGEESPDYCGLIKTRIADLNKTVHLIKAFQVSSELNFADIVKYERFVDYFLFDAKGRLPGGNSMRFNWELLKKYDGNTPYFLSGGIGPGDVGRIRSFLQDPVSDLCHAVDINSRFELSPGMKNIGELESFMSSIRNMKPLSK